MPSTVTVGQITITDQNDPVNAALSLNSFVVPTDSNGNSGNYSGCATTMSILLGAEDVSANWTVTATASSGVTGSLSDKTYTVTNMTVDVGYVDLTASATGFVSVTRRFALSKSKMGAQGIQGNQGDQGIQGLQGPAGINAALNYATPEKWTASSANANGTGLFGGDFFVNGDGNQRVWATDPFGRPALIWKTVNNDVASDADGGWDKNITGLEANKSYMSVVYFRRNSSSTNGSFYHGCSRFGATLNMDGTANGNPYFYTSGISNFIQGEWYVSVGIIHANNSTVTTNSGISGIYRLATGARVYAGTDYKMAAGATTQSHRTYVYYSTDPAAVIEWWFPAFYEINGNEPALFQLTGQSGPSLSVNNDRAATFTASDGNLDSGQSDITFTATVLGIASPTYAWTFSGLQTNPTASTTATQVITAAQFGTAKSAVVTCTVNGRLVDSVTIARLERSTAAAGATVGATWGTNVSSIPANISTAGNNPTVSVLNNAITVDANGVLQGTGTSGVAVSNAVIDIGGTNLLKNSTAANFATSLNGPVTISLESVTLPDGTTGNAIKMVTGATAGVARMYNCLRANDIYSFSTYHRVASGTATTTLDANDVAINSISSTASWKWHKQEGFTVSNYTLTTYNFIDINLSANTTLYFWRPKVEFGNKATDWVPAVEDVNSGIASAATTATWAGVGSIPANISTAGSNPSVSVLNNAISVDAAGTLQGIGTGSGTAVSNVTLQNQFAGTNHAVGSTFTSSVGAISSGFLTDGILAIQGSNYTEFGSGAQWIQSDLGSVKFIGVNHAYWWAYDGRTYQYAIAISKDGTSWTWVRGTGSAAGVVSTYVTSRTMINGYGNNTANTVRFPTIDSVNSFARYIRIYANGNTSTAGNHLYEWQIWSGGAPTDPYIEDYNKTVAVGANKTYVDGSGTIQGVSSGSGTVVSNSYIGINASGELYGAGAGNGIKVSNNQIYIDSSGAVQGIGGGAGTTVSNALVKVGGTNLMRHGGNFTIAGIGANWSTNGSAVTLDTATTYAGKPTLNLTGQYGACNNTIMRLNPDTEYTVSALVKGSSALSGGPDAHLHIQSWRDEDTENVHQGAPVAYDQDITTSWKRVYQTFRTPPSAAATYCRFYFYPLAASYTLNIAYLQLEEGNKATDWKPCPDDVDGSIATAATTATWSSVTGANRPADNATVGATIGVNVSGQINSSNASQFIANAAIGSAMISELNAGKITTGTLSANSSISVGSSTQGITLDGMTATMNVMAPTDWKTFVFIRTSGSAPAKPTGNTIPPAGWSDIPTAGWNSNVYMSIGTVASGGAVTWSTPINVTNGAWKYVVNNYAGYPPQTGWVTCTSGFPTLVADNQLWLGEWRTSQFTGNTYLMGAPYRVTNESSADGTYTALKVGALSSGTYGIEGYYKNVSNFRLDENGLYLNPTSESLSIMGGAAGWKTVAEGRFNQGYFAASGTGTVTSYLRIDDGWAPNYPEIRTYYVKSMTEFERITISTGTLSTAFMYKYAAFAFYTNTSGVQTAITSNVIASGTTDGTNLPATKIDIIYDGNGTITGGTPGMYLKIVSRTNMYYYGSPSYTDTTYHKYIVWRIDGTANNFSIN